MININDNDILNFNKTSGQFFTPRTLVKACLERIIFYNTQKKISVLTRVLDPAVGEGIFFDVFVSLNTSNFLKYELEGIDIDINVLKTAKKRLEPLLNSSILNLELKNKDYLTEFTLNDSKYYYDLIFGNPPHNAKYSNLKWNKIQNTIDFFKNSKLKNESSAYFVLKSIKFLKPGGILGFILPKPLIYSQRWNTLRNLILSQVKLLEVLDLGNQFYGQLQEQILIILEKDKPNRHYSTGYWDRYKKKFTGFTKISVKNALLTDNLLVGVNQDEQELINRLYTKEFSFLNIEAFRGLNSKYRVNIGKYQLIEKRNLIDGILLPVRYYVSRKTPFKIIKKQQIPKIIAQRILSYKTLPRFKFEINTFVDSKGEIISHETVINIISKYNQKIVSLYALAAILQCSFTEWWLRNAIFTRRFVTSKDFDLHYIKKIRFPQDLGSLNEKFRDFIKSELNKNNLDNVLDIVKNESISDKLFTLGEIYKLYQLLGEKIIQELAKIRKNIQKKYLTKTDETKKKDILLEYKSLYDKVINVKNKLCIQNEISEQNVQLIKEFNNEKVNYEKIIDEIVLMIYEITPLERLIIEDRLV